MAAKCFAARWSQVIAVKNPSRHDNFYLKSNKIPQRPVQIAWSCPGATKRNDLPESLDPSVT